MDENKTKRNTDEIYKSKKRLGQGTFGRVEKVLNKIDGKTYAIKVIESNQIFLETFKAEAEAMKRAKSDYTVKLLDHYYDDEKIAYIFVMPYYSKGNLKGYLDKKWSREDILCFLYQICEAFLSFNKQESCWHLDLKPDNILIKSEGEYLICDFGCAKLVDSSNKSAMLGLSSNKGVGTTNYAAPQIIIDQSGTKHSDMWSLGIILYEILYNKHPMLEVNQQNKKAGGRYYELMRQFRKGTLNINFPKIEGKQQIIQICKLMLQDKDRIEWAQLRKSIYGSLGLSEKVSIIVNIERFIGYAQNVSKIAMGLVYYLEKNMIHIENLGLEKPCTKVMRSAKLYVPLLYKQIEETIESTGYVKGSLFYIFSTIQKNYSIQQKQRLQHLRRAASTYSAKQMEENSKLTLPNATMNFNCDVEQFYSQLGEKKRSSPALVQNIHPMFDWHKIEKICRFVLAKSGDKAQGLEYQDRDLIEKCAYDVVYE